MLFGLILGKLKKYMYEEVIGTEKQYCLIHFQKDFFAADETLTDNQKRF